MTTTATTQPGDRRRCALFDVGLRPFFLGAGVWSAAAMAAWLAALMGGHAMPTAFGPLAWHAHEMLFGFAAAVVAGFLLTAVPGWTGGKPLTGAGLAALASLWLAGRVAVTLSGVIGAAPAAAVDLAFLAVLLARTLGQLAGGRNWRNLPVAAGLTLLLAGNALAHAEALGVAMTAGLGHRLGLAAVVMLIALIGGRVVPAFTRNWLNSTGRGGPLPAEPGRFDAAVLALTGLALVAWLAAPGEPVAGGLLGLTALAHAARLARWRGPRTAAEPLLWILHVGYLWLPVGFALAAAAALALAVPASAGLHAFAGGAIGTMTLAMMTRATRGHTGHPLSADAATVTVYLLVLAAGVARVAASLAPAWYEGLLALAGAAWIAAFALFVAAYAGKLWRPRAA